MITDAKKARILSYMIVGDDKGFAGVGCLSAVTSQE